MAKLTAGRSRRKDNTSAEFLQSPAGMAEAESTLPLEEEMIQRVNLSPDEINKIRSYEADQEKLIEELEEA